MTRAKTTEHMACCECRFFYECPPDSDKGFCCRYPPVLRYPEKAEPLDCWWQPTVHAGDWCGEFRPIHDPPCQRGGTGGMTADDLHELKNP